MVADSKAFFKAQELLGDIVDIWRPIRGFTNPLDYTEDKYVTDGAYDNAVRDARALVKSVLVRSNWRVSGERAPQAPEEFALCLYSEGHIGVRVSGTLRRAHDGVYAVHTAEVAYRSVNVDSAWQYLTLEKQDEEAVYWFASLFAYR